MRCAASELCVGSAESAASAAPVGGPAVDPANALEITTAASAATAQLAERSPTGLVEEVQVLRVDGDRHGVADPQLHVRREGCDEVRARSHDARLVLARELVRVGDRLGLDLAGRNLEVRHPLAAEGLHDLDVGVDLRDAFAALSGGEG